MAKGDGNRAVDALALVCGIALQRCKNQAEKKEAGIPDLIQDLENCMKKGEESGELFTGFRGVQELTSPLKRSVRMLLGTDVQQFESDLKRDVEVGNEGGFEAGIETVLKYFDEMWDESEWLGKRMDEFTLSHSRKLTEISISKTLPSQTKSLDSQQILNSSITEALRAQSEVIGIHSKLFRVLVAFCIINMISVYWEKIVGWFL